LLLRLARRRRRAHGSTLQNTDPASHSDKGDLCFWSLEEIRVDLLALGREG
jgi:hypothetical protein